MKEALAVENREEYSMIDKNGIDSGLNPLNPVGMDKKAACPYPGNCQHYNNKLYRKHTSPLIETLKLLDPV